jgi:predicted carbohydrate-binding protein with CBM5 and CBM33 domain
MSSRVALPIAVVAAIASVFIAGPAQGHGYISAPPSRQALCARGVVANCGEIQYEPQSVEAPKGSTLCSGGNARFAVLDDTSRNWPATAVGSSATFSWTLTARHATSTWQYFIGNTQIASFDDGGRQPGATVAHTVNFGSFTGRQTVRAVWNIADTINAFYSCVDLQIGGGGTNPTPTPTPTPTVTPTTPAPTATAQPGGTWAAGTAYAVGARVTYAGLTYQCRQAHTALTGWEPPNVPALWLRV